MTGLVTVVRENHINAKASEDFALDVSVYATKEQLMNSFNPYSDGTAANIGKLAFGKNVRKEKQIWYILGKDDGISGDNIAIFAVYPIEQRNFGSGDAAYSEDWKCTYPDDTIIDTVYSNHYGASIIRSRLNYMAEGITKYFTEGAAEHDECYYSGNEGYKE